MRLELNPIIDKSIEKQLKRIRDQEEISASDEFLKEIISMCNKDIRNAI